MSKPKVGISILTNSDRRSWLQECINAFLVNCHYRPLVFGIHNNGSHDDTRHWLESHLPEAYGVEWRIHHSDKDNGCAVGTNESINLVADCEYQIHLESDFIHMPESETGVDKYWLHRAIAYMQTHPCDYLYLRRMEGEFDIMQHWWAQWMPKVQQTGEFMPCPGFWWSNNPTLFRTKALMESGTLPLNEALDGVKGQPGWSQPELQAAKPPNAHIHQWGMFAHERKLPYKGYPGCGRFQQYGITSCKYGFYKDGKDKFCQACDLSKGIEDMPAHEARYKNGETMLRDDIALGTIVVNDETLEKHLQPCLTNHLNDAMIIDAEPGVPISLVYNKLIEEAHGRFLILCHPDVEFSPDVFGHIRQELSKPEVGVVGLVGVGDDNKQVWAQSQTEPIKVSSLDGCFIAIDRNKGLRFDEQTFDGLHCYAEDLCYQARGQGLKVKVVPAQHFVHASETFSKEGSCWGDYWKYRGRLTEKWQDKMKVVTT